MILKDFIKKYSVGSHRTRTEYDFECEVEEDEGFIIPEGFCLLNSISKIPLFIVAVNREEKAIIKYDGKLSLSIYDNEGQMDVNISKHEEEFKKRFVTYLSFKAFCESITELEFMEVIDAVTNELSATYQIEKSSKKKDAYIEDLMVLMTLTQ